MLPRRHSKPDRSPPVLDTNGNVSQIQRDDQVFEVVRVRPGAVVELGRRRHVAHSHAKVIERDDTVTVLDHGLGDVPIQERPRRIAVDHQDGLAGVSWAFVEIVDAPDSGLKGARAKWIVLGIHIEWTNKRRRGRG